MLNTIYEEFDFEGKIKNLQNKKIKIKKIVKKSTLSESIVIPVENPEARKELPKKNYHQENENIRKQNNPMFLSTAVNSNFSSNFSTPNTIITGGGNSSNSLDPSLSSIFSIMTTQTNKIIFEDPNKKFQEKKAKNQMFLSTNETAIRKGEFLQNKDFDDFVLPKHITKILINQEQNLKKIIFHIEKEKKKIDIDIDSTIKEIIQYFNNTRKKLHTNFDDFLEMYKKNYENLKSRVKKFKEQSIILPEKRGNAYNRHTSVNLKSVAYYGKDPSSYETLQKFKEETCKVQATIDKIDREVSKKLISYLGEELNKQSMHLPLYNHSETSQMLLTELKINVVNFLSDNLENFNHLVFITPYLDFATFTASPKISTVVSEDKISAIGDFKQLRNLNAGFFL